MTTVRALDAAANNEVDEAFTAGAESGTWRRLERESPCRTATLDCVSDVVWLVGTIVVLGAMVVIALRLEPHWSSKDGRRFICRAQVLTDRFEPIGRWHEVRGEIGDGEITIRSRSPLVRTVVGRWDVHARGDTDKRKRRTFMLRRDEDGKLLALRMPESSRSTALIDEQLAQ